MIISPQKPFLIETLVNNPGDTDTHYVRSVITNSISGVVLATINLTDRGNGYFSKEWTTPADPTGTGMQISIKTTVYDDTDYSVVSPVYGSTLETYIVRSLASSQSFLGAGGQGVDYKNIEKIVKKIVQDSKPILPEAEKFDFGKLESIITACLQEYDRTEEIKEALKPLTEKSREAEESDKELHGFITSTLESYDKKLTDFKQEVNEMLEGFKKEMSETLAQPVKIELQPTSKAREPKEPENPRAALFSKLLGV